MIQYSENDLRTVWKAYQGKMKKYQLAEMMMVSIDDVMILLNEAQKLYGRAPKQFKKEPSVHDPVVTPDAPVRKSTRPAARYDNMSSEEKINYYLSLEV